MAGQNRNKIMTFKDKKICVSFICFFKEGQALIEATGPLTLIMIYFTYYFYLYF